MRNPYILILVLVINFFSFFFNRDFLLRFGLANTTNDDSRLKIRVMCGEILTLIEFVIPNLSQVYQKSLK